MEITRHSKLLDVLEAYPFLEDQIVHIAPPFKNLKNPVLRRTVGKLATLEQVAQIGGMDASKLVNTLRKAAGQAELSDQPAAAPARAVPRASGDPEWIAGEPQYTLNGTEMLARGEVPLGKVNELLGTLAEGNYLLLITNFEPTPILDAMQKQNRRVFHKASAENDQEHWTFIG